MLRVELLAPSSRAGYGIDDEQQLTAVQHGAAPRSRAWFQGAARTGPAVSGGHHRGPRLRYTIDRALTDGPLLGAALGDPGSWLPRRVAGDREPPMRRASEL
jgi:hypothetical protein